ncbi:metallophosphoesterase family protein [Endozoicomonas sp. SM1973]|uniref:Metallophosphoesterase family protein n=1 Tax=Spartinivicinus marinus TaxID=2994442 RepID=A0A853I4P0_9GAMM|nr:metallophosphoesterase family protein [Spartinivicinus marinus]MCX4026723.1 metallophosphoesterase family protein [Spartinivicinus marinus]NYZ64557.1 metallophosphoesterase family protein [Spartinivicinus marinus]
MKKLPYRVISAGMVTLLILFSKISMASIKPYLQSPTESSIWISWKTVKGAESLVEYGLNSSDLNQKATGNNQLLAIGYRYHGVQLTGLQPDTLYHYRVKTGEEYSAVYRFRTQPKVGERSGHYRILVMGDHQIRNQNRYEQLVKAAKSKLEEKYSIPIEESINLVLNVGDQVDVGTLDHYENLHFAQSAAISPNVPIMTTVGNHEYYSDGKLKHYRAHFFYDGLSYQGISGATNESYYAYQQGRLLIIHLNSMKTDFAQKNWLTQVLSKADVDNNVDWIISVIHHPYQAEQYIGDISKTLRNEWMALLSSTKKHVLNISGHHHLYARGQTREWPIYHVISGGTAWDQYWGQSTEVDYDDVQKTIANWAWQLIDINLATREMTVETYAEGHPLLYKTRGFHYNSRLIDTFHRKLDLVKPNSPTIVNSIINSIKLPYTFKSSAFSSIEAESINSTQFQIATDTEFKQLNIDKIRDFENIYGDTGSPDYEPVDIHAGLDILSWTIPERGLPNGSYFIRVRHRDKNVQWSEWSAVKTFTVTDSTNGETVISINKTKYRTGEAVTVTYNNGYSNTKDWIGIYKKNQAPGSVSSTQWAYANQASGQLTFNGLADGEYYVGFFADDGYKEIADRVHFYIGPVVELKLEQSALNEGGSVVVRWSGSNGNNKDWIGVYQMGEVPGEQVSNHWRYTPATLGTVNFKGLSQGKYFVGFFSNDGYLELSERVEFSVGEDH